MDQNSVPQRPSTRPRSKSSFSLRSGKSDKSLASNPFSSGKPKVKLGGGETESDKRRKRLSDKSYADPSRAINEAQPAVRNLMEGSTLVPIRSMQHKDMHGNVINDPDSSNPARSRMERPLDTIRSFEAAIDAGYKRRNPMPRSETAPESRQFDYSSRRSSYVDDESTVAPRYGQRPSYGGPSAYHGYGQNPHYRSNPLRQSSFQDRHHQGSNGYHQQGRPQRMSSMPMAQRGHSDFGIYNNHNYHESYDTMQTGDSAGSSEPWTNSTDPSSENSSVDRGHHARGGDAYGVNHGSPYGPVSPVDGSMPEGFRPNGYTTHGAPRYGENGLPLRGPPTPGPMNGMSGNNHVNHANYPQPPPHMTEQPPRNVIKLGEPQFPPPPQQQQQQQQQQQPGQWQPRYNQGVPPGQRNTFNGPPPPPPTKDRQVPGRQPTRLQRNARAPAAPAPPEKEKRKSWLRRLF